MPMLGSRNGDGVHIFHFEDAAKVLLAHRSLIHLLLRMVGELLENGGIDIADMRDARGFFICLERGEMGVGAAIQANHGEVKAVIRTEDLAVAFCRRSYGQAGGTYGERIEEFTSCHHRVSLLSSAVVISRKFQPSSAPF